MTLDQQILQDWQRLKETGRGFMNSFQTRSVKIREDGDLYTGKFGFQEQAYGDGGTVLREMNTYFGSSLSDSNRGQGEVYVLLKRNGSRGELISYGACHTDTAGRESNMHYFVVEGEYALLQKTAEGFRQEPRSIAQFVDVVFDWSNPNHKSLFTHGNTAMPNVVSDMKRLYLLEVAREYSAWEKMKIKWNGNPEVKMVEV